MTQVEKQFTEFLDGQYAKTLAASKIWATSDDDKKALGKAMEEFRLAHPEAFEKKDPCNLRHQSRSLYKKTGTVTHAMEAVSAVKCAITRARALGRAYAAQHFPFCSVFQGHRRLKVMRFWRSATVKLDRRHHE